MADPSEAQHVLELSRELLDDIELDRLPSDKLLLKVSRLARLAGAEETREWLGYEIGGYNFKEPVAQKYLTLTGRREKPEDPKAFIVPLAQLETAIDTARTRIDATKLNSVSGDMALASVTSVTKTHQSLAASISTYTAIRSRVIGILHSFVTSTYYERLFANFAESTFDGYKRDVDALIAAKAGDVLSKISSVIARLKDGDSESISQALTTCRRILEAFADAIYPSSDETIEIDGNQLKLDASKHKNRINAYIAQNCESGSRRTRLRQNLSNLFDRVSTGVHTDVSVQEAYSLFLNVYLFLGETLNLGDPVKEVSVQ